MSNFVSKIMKLHSEPKFLMFRNLYLAFSQFTGIGDQMRLHMFVFTPCNQLALTYSSSHQNAIRQFVCNFNVTSQLTIAKKDGVVYILPECIAFLNRFLKNRKKTLLN